VVVTSAPEEPGLSPATIAALQSRVVEQSRERLGRSKSQRLSRVASDLEQAIILRAPQLEIDRLCVEVAALALRCRENGD
jgi:hypothetical protein